MGKNFMLKDAGGRPGGYLTQGLGKLRCAIKNGGEGELTLVYADGGESVRRLRAGAEGEWPDDGRAILAAYVTAGNQTLFTCERAKRAWERQQNARMMRRMRAQREEAAGREAEQRDPYYNEAAHPENTAQEKDENERRTAAAHNVEEKESEVPADETETPMYGNAIGHEWPQARWPVPPCWPTAVYVSGRWQEA